MIPESIRNLHGERIATTFVPGVQRSSSLVVIGHGVTSDKTRPWSVGLSDALAARGVASLRIAFTGNGESEGRFEDATITKEVDDLGAVLDAVLEDGVERRVAYVGHSMGGAVGLLRATRDDRLAAVALLAPVVHTAEFVTRMFGHLQPGEPMLGKPQCPFSEALREDLLRYDSLASYALDLVAPCLVVHGSSDDVVPVNHSHDFHDRAPERSELVVLEGVDHSFTGAGLGAMVHVVAPWLVERLV